MRLAGVEPAAFASGVRRSILTELQAQGWLRVLRLQGVSEGI